MPGTVLSTSGTLFHVIVPQRNTDSMPCTDKEWQLEKQHAGRCAERFTWVPWATCIAFQQGPVRAPSLYTGAEIRYRGMKQMAAQRTGVT